MSLESLIPQEPFPDQDDMPTDAVMRLAEQGGAFDFWLEDGEGIYTAQDGEPLSSTRRAAGWRAFAIAIDY